MSKIKNIKAREILNSKGNWTIEVELETEEGAFRASVPTGTSKGKYEVFEIKPKKAVGNIEKIINSKLKGEDATYQKKIDQILNELDGTENKSKLGANTILGVSIACCRAGAETKKIPLYQHIAEIFNLDSTGSRLQRQQFSIFNLPFPCFNILNGGVHAGSNLDFQEFMVIPRLESFKENLLAGVEIYHHLKKILERKFSFISINVGEEGGFTPPIAKTKDALNLILEAIRKAGYEGRVKIGLDSAASEFFKEGKYDFEGEKITGEELLKFYQDLIKDYPILFFEDPFSQDDWQNWQQFYSSSQSCGILEKDFLLVGDDLTVTNPKKIKQAKEKDACNAIILKPNQIGTITEALRAAKSAKEFEWKIIPSHRSGDTCDDFISDLSVGIGADFIKAGAPARGERVAKYNRLLKIEEEIINK